MKAQPREILRMSDSYILNIGPLDAARANLITDALAESLESSAAVALNLDDNEAWRIEIISSGPPDLGVIQNIVRASSVNGAPFPPLTLSPLPEEDWVARSQEGLAPVRAGRFLIHGSHDRATAHSAPLAIEIDAGQAFGTAHHGTTRGCLVALDLVTRKRQFTNVIDVGTGTGVLAIAAAKVTGARVLASDIDPVAVRVARENCRHNGTAGLVSCVCSAGLMNHEIQARRPYDLVIANILAGPLKTLAYPILEALRPNGVVILSGILNEQAGPIIAHYCTVGFALRTRIELEGWSTLVMLRK